ncbi:hypothetical protein C4559_01225 [Candidatus Microgenomates bacterium]|nr:MAG: hypothetical protein C4559_01225 [Candidatus Microgenomates bacterium]
MKEEFHSMARFIRSRISKSPEPSKEISEAEMKVKEIIVSAESTALKMVLGKTRETEESMKRVAGNRSGMCSFFPDIVRYCAEHNGASCILYQVSDIHKFYRGVEGFYLGHVFNVVAVDKTKFLVDLSFSQYVRPNGIASQYKPGGCDTPASVISSRFKGYKDSNHPLAQKLIKDGYVLLTDKSLRTYLDITSYDNAKYLRTAKVEDLNHVRLCHQEWSNEQLERELLKKA